MERDRQSAHEAHARETPSRPSPSRPAAAYESVLALQRTAGNRAVAHAFGETDRLNGRPHAPVVVQRGGGDGVATTASRPVSYPGHGKSIADEKEFGDGTWAISIVQSKTGFAGHAWVLIEGPATNKDEKAWQWLAHFVAPMQTDSAGELRSPTLSELLLANSPFGRPMIGKICLLEDRAARDRWFGLDTLSMRTFRVPAANGRAAQDKIKADQKRRIPYRMLGHGVLVGPSDAESCSSWAASVVRAAGIEVGGWVLDTPSGVAGNKSAWI